MSNPADPLAATPLDPPAASGASSRTPEDDTLGGTQGNASGDARATLLATISRKREEAKAPHALDLDIPGYDGLLVARFRPFPIDKLEAKIGQYQQLQGKQPILLRSACDTLVDACEQVMLRKESEGDPFPIDEEAVPPIAFDSRLAEIIGFQATSARQVIMGLFPTEQAILAMNVEVSRWMQDVTRRTDEAFLGE